MSIMLRPQSSWALASKDEKRRAKSMFFIPKNAKRTLLPDKHISIWDMLQFELPPIISMRSMDIPNYDTFFSSEAPSPTTSEIFQKLRTLPLLPAKVVYQLNDSSREHWMKGALSVRYAHVPGEETLFPLWIISYWMVLCNHYTNVYKPWTRNLAWVQVNRRRSNGNLRQEADLTFNALQSIPWTTPKAGFAESEPIYSLWRVLGTNWMNSTAVDNALELLAVEVNRNAELTSQFVVLDTEFMTKLVGLFAEEEERVEEYDKQEWLKAVGEEIFVEGKTLVTIAHLGKLPLKKGETEGSDHWVPVAIAGTDHKFLYGDSLCGKKTPVMPPKLLKILTAWKDMHTFSRFTIKMDTSPDPG